MKTAIIAAALLFTASSLFYNCTNSSGNTAVTDSTSSSGNKYGGYASPEAWGAHLVIIAGCGDCHSPKVMTAQGPVPDTTRALSGAPSQPLMPPATADQIAKGMAATIDMTVWVGPWGKSYAANITSDSTGIGDWTEQQFTDCLRKGV